MKTTLFFLAALMMGTAQAQSQTIDYTKFLASQQTKINNLITLVEAQAEEIKELKRQMKHGDEEDLAIRSWIGSFQTNQTDIYGKLRDHKVYMDSVERRTSLLEQKR